jgi:hypothetical protein
MRMERPCFDYTEMELSNNLAEKLGSSDRNWAAKAG